MAQQVNVEDFSQDLGMDIKNGSFPMPNLKQIVLTQASVQGQMLRDMGSSCEISHEVNGSMDRFRFPISVEKFNNVMKKREMVAFTIDRPLKT